MELIKYVGDISKADAAQLYQVARSNTKILEFGCGASTQILAHYSDHSITSIDDTPDWIEITKKNMKDLGIQDHTDFHEYHNFMSSVGDKKFGFIFNDGADGLRLPFAIEIWKNLEDYGVLAFHDTRRHPDVRNVLALVDKYPDEVMMIDFNRGESNITFVYKRPPLLYENWQITEGKTPEQIGYNHHYNALKKEA